MVIHIVREVPKITKPRDETIQVTLITLAKRSKRFMRAPRAPPRLQPWDRSKCKDFNRVICKAFPAGKIIVSC